MLAAAPTLSLNDKLSRLRNSFYSGQTKSLAFRIKQLKGLQSFLIDNQAEIETALYQDLRKPSIEAFVTEINIISTELKLTLKHLAQWMKPKKVSTPLVLIPGKSKIYAEPLGLVLIIAPWNYPIQLSLVPLIGALAAGNCVVLKPSELASATSQLLAAKLPQYIDAACLQIVEGGAEETNELLKNTFDHIFFTGSAATGKKILATAAPNLTPVTLELGGKSPCIVDETANLEVAARRIVWAKFTNAGQTCVAPDYILVHESIEHIFLEELKQTIIEFYGDSPEKSPDYGRIINNAHFQRLKALITGEVAMGGVFNEKSHYISPTLLRNVPLHAPVMQEEIFGPILPVIRYNKISDAVDFINVHPKPLAIYLFSSQQTIENQIIQETSSGGVCINHVMQQVAVPELPFGGVGASGIGAYHGKASFDTFTHYKSVFNKPVWFDPDFAYPPYQEMLRKILRWFS